MILTEFLDKQLLKIETRCIYLFVLVVAIVAPTKWYCIVRIVYIYIY